MALFADVVIEWKGRNYTVPSNQIMRLIATIEDTVTMGELTEYLQGGKMPMAKLALAFSNVLKFAGVISEDGDNDLEQEVYAAWFGVGGVDARDSVVMSIHSLLAMMIPPTITEQVEANNSEAGKPKADSSS